MLADEAGPSPLRDARKGALLRVTVIGVFRSRYAALSAFASAFRIAAAP